MDIDEILDSLETCGRRKTPRIIWESVLYYYGSILLNKYRFKKTVGTDRHIKYYSIVFAKSGQGKTFSSGVVEKLCRLEKYPDSMMSYYMKYLESLPVDIAEESNDVIKYMPKSVTISVEGTAEGLFDMIKSQVESNFGSTNLFTDEFGEVIASSSGLLSKLKEAYDGTIKAKVIRGSEDQSVRNDITNITCNFLGLGSRKGVSTESEKELKRIASSGMYRRTFIIENKDLVEKNTTESDISKLEVYFEEINKKHTNALSTLSASVGTVFIDRFMKYSNDYNERIETIDDELIASAHSDQLNEFAQYNTGSLEIVIDLSHIIAFLEDDDELKLKHIEKAYDFMVRTRESVEDTFKSVHPYKLMYDLLKMKSNMTISEMTEFEDQIPVQKTKIQDNLDLLEELCYRRDEILVKNKGKVTRYSIESLPKTNLKKLILSMSTDNKGKFAINFKPGELAWENFEKLVTSKNVDSFTTCHYEPTSKAPEGHREAKSAIEGQNMIAFDIDENMTIEEAQEALKEYTYIMYTTKSHQKDKNGEICDRFRIILPTETMFYVTPEQHKLMYENIEKVLGIHSNDPQTRNVSRLFYTNPDADVFHNDGERLVDVSCCIPSTDKSDKIMPIMENIAEQEESGEMDRREAGIIKWVLMNTTTGNRNGNLFRAGMFFKDNGQDFAYKLQYINNMLLEPVDDRELKAIVSSVARK